MIRRSSLARRLSRRASIVAVLIAASVAVVGVTGVVEGRGAPSWISRLVHAIRRRAESRPVQAMLPDTVVVFGPKTFSLGIAPSATFVEAFSVSSPDSGGYVLRVVNAPGGAVHVTDGNVALNGRTV